MTWRPAMIGFCVLGAPAAAQATDVSLSFGTTVASGYVSEGIRTVGGPLVQPFVEVGIGGAYLGAHASNVDADLTGADMTGADLAGADMEYGLSLGYRGKAGRVGCDLGPASCMYKKAFPDFPVEDFAVAIASRTLTVTDTLCLTAEAAVAAEFDQTILTLRSDHDTALKGLSVGAIIGRLDANDGASTYGSVDAAHAVSEQVSPGFACHDSNVDLALGLFNTDGPFAVSESLDF